MSNVYVNLLGNWTNLTKNDTINGESAEDFAREILTTNSLDLSNKNGFCKVTHNNTDYIVHFSQIQYLY